MSSAKTTTSIYPLDKNRKLVAETVDETGTIHRVFKLFAPDGDSMEVEFIEKKPQPVMRPLDIKRKIIAQEKNEDGYLVKLMMCEEANGDIKEYWIEEKIPTYPSHLPSINRGEEIQQVPAAKRSKVAVDEMKVAGEFIALLLKTKVADLSLSPSGTHVLVAMKNQPAADVFRGLIEHGYLSAPVLGKDARTYKGFIDMLDFIHYFVGEFGMEDNQIDLSLMRSFEIFKQQRVKDLMVPHGPINVRPFGRDYSLYSVLETLAREPQLHRVPVVDSQNVLVSVVTQSKLVDFAANNLNLLGLLRFKPLYKIPGILHEVEKIYRNEPTIRAFDRMLSKNITGVAVVDEQNRLVGNISARDLKFIDSDGKWWARLLATAGEYLHWMNFLLPDPNRSKGAIFVTPTDTFEIVLKFLTKYHIHRVYIVNNEIDMQPVGVIGLKEVLGQLLVE